MLTIILGITLSAVSAQDSIPQIHGTIYSFMPQYLINNGIRIDIEKQLKNKHFIQVSPQFYLSEQNKEDGSNSDDNSFTNLVGGGVNIYHKYFVDDDFLKNPLYISYGLSYNYFNIDYYDEYLGSLIHANADIHKMGVDITVGYQKIIGDVVSLDIFTGLGTRYSVMGTDSESDDRFNSSYYGYNYTGNLMLLGLKIGLIK